MRLSLRFLYVFEWLRYPWYGDLEPFYLRFTTRQDNQDHHKGGYAYLLQRPIPGEFHSHGYNRRSSLIQSCSTVNTNNFSLSH